MKVTSHLLGRPVLPSSKEGPKRLLDVEPTLEEFSSFEEVRHSPALRQHRGICAKSLLADQQIHFAARLGDELNGARRVLSGLAVEQHELRGVPAGIGEVGKEQT